MASKVTAGPTVLVAVLSIIGLAGFVAYEYMKAADDESKKKTKSRSITMVKAATTPKLQANSPRKAQSPMA
ncbi:hypothetical protein SDRG_04152 [Saprolegnia diclina VS20]|uniref:Uncharacterized protein n=1 Tax=Saprolegnia diclina (strain VS20) TaxID=1156394 RepID=T0S0H4_SAPDV|nr:hypothetical protein SDRG_04152 [Saprolegnia diclina VS20]EQC38443.1 hypothetical protein SDRG_04152 [Saprolegnia diclina VS20]|eukprot:XP_008608035.1 hypothetical protein SDRG_04152 [Saprolegnia diclina VS20]